MNPRPRPHRGRIPQATTFAVLILAVVAPACATLGIGGINLISIEEEWEMGRQFEVELAQELPLSNDPVVNDYVERIGRLLVSQTEMADLDWRFYVVEEPEVNAFNVPGGLVYVYSGLIREAGSAAELVGVIGHELGHGIARHGTERLSRQYGLAVLAQAVLGEDPGLIQQIVAEIVAVGAISQFSRSQEFEADEIGVHLMSGGGYHPQGMVALLERLLELREREPGAVERFFATHPDVSDRIDRVEDQIGAFEELAGLRMDDDQFRTIQERLQ